METAGRPANRAALGAGLDIGAVYESALPRLKRIAAGLGLGAADAEDALHDSYVALLQRSGQFAEVADATRWLARVMVNRCRLHHRRRRRWLRAAGNWVLRRRDPRPADDDQAAVRQCLTQMDGDDVAMLVLRYFCDFNATEVGEILQVPAGTVRSRLRRARLALAEQLLARGLGDDWA